MKAQQSRKLPNVCPSCASKGDIWESKKAEIEQVLRKETFSVPADVNACTKCGYQLLAAGALENLAKATADAYRKKHGLLTGAEIRSIRLRIRMSQQEFADRIQVGIASLKRWENGHIQDKSSDRLLRLAANMTRKGESYASLGRFTFLLQSKSTRRQVVQELCYWKRPSELNECREYLDRFTVLLKKQFQTTYIGKFPAKRRVRSVNPIAPKREAAAEYHEELALAA